jgi:general secretion pathway protein H
MMPMSAIGRCANGDESGFTLVELMVVLTILALSTAVVLLVLPDQRTSLPDTAEKLAARIALVRDEAVIAARPMAVAVDEGGYRFEERRGGDWLALGDKALKAQAWEGGIRAEGSERIVFDSTGATERDVAIGLAREGERVSIEINASGGVHVAR